jgi:2-dehydro-3-deoxyphosphogalactonate aldolase
MTAVEDFQRYFAEMPLVAIIRGVTPEDAEATARAIFDAGIRIIEVPLNSPQPFDSIKIIADAVGDRTLIGAGTVLNTDNVKRVQHVGGRLIVAPNTDAEVIRATVSAGMVSSPGYFTPSEAFAAIEAGAHALKLFPAEAASPNAVKAQKAVLPKDVPLIVVGGVNGDNIGGWLDCGADGFGLGSGLYKPGQDAEETHRKAKAFVAAVKGS